ncbi:MAG: hypothetical protein ABUS49_09400, partial [Acidobacteriota bacterium]
RRTKKSSEPFAAPGGLFPQCAVTTFRLAAFFQPLAIDQIRRSRGGSLVADQILRTDEKNLNVIEARLGLARPGARVYPDVEILYVQRGSV